MWIVFEVKCGDVIYGHANLFLLQGFMQLYVFNNGTEWYNFDRLDAVRITKWVATLNSIEKYQSVSTFT